MQLPANGEILHSSWDFLVRCHPRWISWCYVAAVA
jgi:hypothetical protein